MLYQQFHRKRFRWIEMLRPNRRRHHGKHESLDRPHYRHSLALRIRRGIEHRWDCLNHTGAREHISYSESRNLFVAIGTRWTTSKLIYHFTTLRVSQNFHRRSCLIVYSLYINLSWNYEINNNFLGEWRNITPFICKYLRKCIINHSIRLNHSTFIWNVRILYDMKMNQSPTFQWLWRFKSYGRLCTGVLTNRLTGIMYFLQRLLHRYYFMKVAPWMIHIPICDKMGHFLKMVVSMLPLSQIGKNDHREDAPLFI